MKHTPGYEQFYSHIEAYFARHGRMRSVFQKLYTFLPWLVVASYGILIVYAIVATDLMTVVKIIVVPVTTFIVVTIFRYCLDAPRPYKKYAIQPLMKKEKAGESMPSRHMVSAGIIAMVWLYVSQPMGIFLWIVAVLIGSIRIIAGVHFPRDIVVAVLICIFFGYCGLWLL